MRKAIISISLLLLLILVFPMSRPLYAGVKESDATPGRRVTLIPIPLYAGYKEGVAAYVRGDFKIALKKFKALAEKGDASAQFYLGVIFYEGNGVPKDYKEAVKWYRMAAEQGYTSAQHNLGIMYAISKGVAKDYVLSYKWLNLASSRGDEDSRKALDSLEKLMTQGQITEGQRLSRGFKAKGSKR